MGESLIVSGHRRGQEQTGQRDDLRPPQRFAGLAQADVTELRSFKEAINTQNEMISSSSANIIMNENEMSLQHNF